MKPGSLYDRIFGFLGQLIALNLLWIVCSLPVITAGASTTALYYCTLKLHKDGDIRVFHDFFKSMRIEPEQEQEQLVEQVAEEDDIFW